MIKNILSFIENAPKKPLLCIAGPTSAGKTGISIQIAKKINGEIINVDSKQVYKGIAISTGQATQEEMQGVSHYLLNFVDPSYNYTIHEHKNEAIACIEDIHSRGKIPILVGGTGLIINSITQNFQLRPHSNNNELKAELEKLTSEELWEKITKIDPDYAKKTHMNNRVRVIRALEMYNTTQKKMSEGSKGEELYSSLIVMPNIDREALYKKIDKRAIEIWNGGLKDEARVLFDKKLDEKLPALMSLGIPEAFRYFRNEITNEEAITSMQQKTRNYAKRQLTWWRNDERVQEISSTDFSNT